MDARATEPLRYPAAFRDGDGPVAVGAIVVERDCMLFDGRHDAEVVSLAVSYEDVVEVRCEHGTKERLNGWRTLVVLRRATPPVRIAPLGFGLRWELADVLDTRMGRHAVAVPTERVAIVVPLQGGSENDVRALLAQGPPFDTAAQGLARHEVYLGGDEAVFVFEGHNVHDVLWRAIAEPGFWQAGQAWRRHIAGSPRLSDAPVDLAGTTELVYSWAADQE
jgi:hypothetical protein